MPALPRAPRRCARRTPGATPQRVGAVTPAEQQDLEGSSVHAVAAAPRMPAVTTSGPSSVARPGSLRRSVRPVPGVPGRADRPGPVLRRPRRDSVRQLGGYARPVPARTVLDVGGGPGLLPPTRSRPPAPATSALDADLGELAGPGRRGPGTRARRRDALPLRRRLRRRLLLQPTSSSTSPSRADGRGDGPGHPARRRGRPVVHELVVAVGRARDLALALPRRRAGRAGGTAAATATSPRTGTAVRCSRSRSAPVLRWARRSGVRTSTWSPPGRATTRTGRAGSSRVPGLREVVAWNLSSCCASADVADRHRGAASRLPRRGARGPVPGADAASPSASS